MEEKLLEDRAGTKLDDLLNRIGVGKYHYIREGVFCAMMIPYVFQILIMYFASMAVPWKCVANSTQCSFNTTRSVHDNSRCSLPRTEWEYVTPKDYSISTQLDLICERKWMHHFLNSIVFIGWGFGAVLFGYLADNFGRRLILVGSFIMIQLVSLLSAFLTSFWALAICRFLVGTSIPGIQVQGVNIVSEFVGPKYRAAMVMFPSIFFSVALCLLPLHAYYLQQWKNLLIVCSAPYFFLAPLAVWLIPESVRWLVLKGKREKAMEILEKMAIMNGKESVAHVQIVESAGIKYKTTVLDVFKKWPIAIRSICQGFIWFTAGLVYYGLALAANDLGGSVYLNFFLLTIVQIPSAIWAIDLCERFGRKKSVMVFYLMVSISCAVIAGVPFKSNVKILRVIFGMVGKFSMSVVFTGLYLWAVELYPTSIRSNGNGFLQVTSRIGAASAPWLTKGLMTLHLSLPFIVMAVLSFVSTGVTVFLPETKNQPTCDTVDDVLEKAKDQKVHISLK